MTLTLQETERISVRRAVALILTASVEQGLPFPYAIRQNGVGSDILAINFNSIADLRAWVDFFDAKVPEPRRHPTIEPPIMFVIADANWHGWSMQMCADDPIIEHNADDVEAAACILGAACDLPQRVPGANLGEVAYKCCATCTATSDNPCENTPLWDQTGVPGCGDCEDASVCLEHRTDAVAVEARQLIARFQA